MRGEGDPLALGMVVVSDQCHADAADWAGYRKPGKLRGSGCGIDGHDIVHVLWIHGHDSDNHLHLVA